MPVNVHTVHVVDVFIHIEQYGEHAVQFVLLFVRNVPSGHGL